MRTTISEIVQNENSYLNEFKRSILQELHCSAPGIIQSYDSSKQTATIQLAIRDARRDGQYEDLPLLLDVPVFFPGGSAFRLTYDIQPGDECLVIFADSCADAWQLYGGVRNPVSSRRHDLSDGFAIVGFSSAANTIEPDSNAISMHVKVDNRWVTPFAIDKSGRVLIHGVVLEGGES